MTAIYFIEINGIKYYKTDSFWSMSENYTHAKRHTDSSYDQDRFFKSLIDVLNPYTMLGSFYKGDVQKCVGGLYGYQHILCEGELSDPFYLRVIDSILENGQVEWSDAKVTFRDKLIDDIIK